MQFFQGVIIREMLLCTRTRRGGVVGGSRQLSNAARSKFLQGTSASFSFFITRELKIETGLDRDPEIDRGHHSYKRRTIQEYSVCEAGALPAYRRALRVPLLWDFSGFFSLKETPLLQW